MSKRQDIVNALANIATQTKKFKSVSEWKMTDFAPAQCPSLSIRDTTDQISRTAYQTDEHALTVEVQIVTTGAKALFDLRELLDGFTQVLASNKTLDGNVEKYNVPSISIGADEQGKQIAVGNINLSLIYETDIGKQ